jgi:rubrerythrin
MPFYDDVREPEDLEPELLALAPRPTPWSWLPPIRWRCLRCDTVILTREAGPRCPVCGYREGT